ncbi:hypothetical protein EDB86DRAFT_43802 [Lactarius hatsudake]|nr:hypothetical protein EDB86DRAFT_43802 [Lactarius hatsudake]
MRNTKDVGTAPRHGSAITVLHSDVPLYRKTECFFRCAFVCDLKNSFCRAPRSSLHVYLAVCLVLEVNTGAGAMFTRSLSRALKPQTVSGMSANVRGRGASFTTGVRNVPVWRYATPHLRHFKMAVRWLSMSTRDLHGISVPPLPHAPSPFG